MKPGAKVLFNSKRFAAMRRLPNEWVGYMHCNIISVDEAYVALLMPISILSTDRLGNPVRISELRLSRYIEQYPVDFPDVPWDETSPQFKALPKPLPRIDVLAFMKEQSGQ